MKKIITLFFALLIVFSLVGCGNNTEESLQLSVDSVKKITIIYGNDGSQVEITDEETIAAITENFNTLILNRDKKIDSTGWTYSVGWYDADGNELTKIYCGAQSDSITRDGYVWKIASGSIDVDLLNDLLKIQ